MNTKVVHFEIPADDVERARHFYKSVFGWKITDVPGMDYAFLETAPTDERNMLVEPGAINGGMLKRQEPVSNIVVTIGVDDIDAIAEDIERAGGRLLRPKMAVGDMGFAAYFADSEGNVVGLWQNAMKQEMSLPLLERSQIQLAA